jgi:hypothetical protein
MSANRRASAIDETGMVLLRINACSKHAEPEETLSARAQHERNVHVG